MPFCFRDQFQIRRYRWRWTGTYCTSVDAANELREIGERQKFDRYVPVSSRRQRIEMLIEGMEPVSIAHRFQVCRDSKDDIVLELAVNGKADYIITGDKDLLAMHPFEGIAILTPADYLALGE